MQQPRFVRLRPSFARGAPYAPSSWCRFVLCTMGLESDKPGPLTPPRSAVARDERQRRLEADVAALARVQILAGATIPPPASPSIPVQAAKGTYRLTKQAMQVIGLLATLAEVFGGNDYGPLRAIARWFFESVP